MKWYTCINEEALPFYGIHLIGAIHSALQNTTLIPHLIYAGKPNKLISYFERLGVKVIYHTLSFLDMLPENYPKSEWYRKSNALGAYLYIDLPKIDSSDDTVLFTDVDVIFLNDPPINIFPVLFAAAKEYELTNVAVKSRTVYNSGVIYINLKKFRESVDKFINFAKKNNFYDGTSYDQSLLNKFYENYFQEIDDNLNWRAFTKASSAPKIIHYHGLKSIYLFSSVLLNGAGNLKFHNDFYKINEKMFDLSLGLSYRFLNYESLSFLFEILNNHFKPFINLSSDSISIIKKKIANLSSFFLDDSFVNANTYGQGYADDFFEMFLKYVPLNKKLNILEWGTGFSTLIIAFILKFFNIDFSMLTMDNNADYQNKVSKWVYANGNIEFSNQTLVGNCNSTYDKGLNYTQYPLSKQKYYDLIFIDGRRRIECGFVASILSHPETIVIMHDYRRERYQSLLKLFYIIEDNKNFRVMKIRPEIWTSYHCEEIGIKYSDFNSLHP